MTETETIISLTATAFEKGLLKKLVLSKLNDKKYGRVTASAKSGGGKRLFVVEFTHTDGKVTQKNCDGADASVLSELLGGAAQANLITTVGECEYRVGKSGKCVLLGTDKLSRALSAAECGECDTPLNREKNYILKGDEKFLRILGISDASGRVHDKAGAKFRQINKFLEYVRDILPDLKNEGKLFILDLCCGKSYLSFAVYHYFNDILGRDIEMLGVDRKEDVIDFCNGAARDCGFVGLRFECGDICELKCEGHPDLVLSLHACDIATDLVLSAATRLSADVILSTPCCHRDLSRHLNCDNLSFVSRHSILKSKLCDALTDALRLLYLEKEGYSVSATELIDPSDTPKNVLLRAVRKKNFKTDSDAAKRAAVEYEKARNYLLGDNR